MASDAVLQQVVAVLEAVPSRSMLDPIIEAARPRLKLIRPPRPITFARILFLPFDGAVVPMEEWSEGSAKFHNAQWLGHAKQRTVAWQQAACLQDVEPNNGQYIRKLPH